MEKIRIFIGSDIYNVKAEKTLDYSIRKHTKSDIDFIVMSRFLDNNDWKGWKHTNKWATCFSCFRWAIPAVCNFQGKAIYLDSDMLVLGDILDLYNSDCSAGIATTPKRSSSVAVFDCSKFADIPEFQLDNLKNSDTSTNAYFGILKNRGMVSYITQDWNCLDGDGWDKNKTKLVHYTDLQMQPWHPAPHRFSYKAHVNQELAELWLKYYEESFEK